MKIIVGDIYRYASAVFVLSLVSMHTLFADELLLRDGSRVHGEVVKKEGGTLEFKTSHSGVMNVNWSEVDELITEKPHAVDAGRRSNYFCKANKECWR